MSEYKLLKTAAFQNFIDSQSDIKKRYDEIRKRYGDIVKELCEGWKGKGADAFREDSEKVMTNITGIQDILNTVCDTLNDCLEIFDECDNSLGKANQDSLKTK